MQPDERRRIIVALDTAAAALADARRAIARDPDDEPAPDPVAQAEATLRRCAEERGMLIRPGDYVSEEDAAALLGRARGTLKNWRSTHRPLPYRRFLGRIEYAIGELARFSVEAAEDPDE